MTWTKRPWARLSAALALVASLAYGLALVQNRALWGFWSFWFPSRPTLATELDGLIVLHGVSEFDLLARGVPVLSLEPRAKLIESARKMCSPESPDRGLYCLDERLLLRLTERFGSLEGIPQVAPGLLSEVWTQYRTEGWHPAIAPGYEGRLHRGLVIQFGRGTQEYLIVAFHTLEIAGDRYAYAEALYRLRGSRPVLIGEHRFFYEVAGAEGWVTPVLTVINLLLLGPGVLLIALARSRLTFTGVTGVVLGSFVLLTSLLFLTACAWFLWHLYWSLLWEGGLVGVTWACVLGVPALLAIAVCALKLRARASSATVAS